MGRLIGMVIGLVASVTLGMAGCHEGGESDPCDGIDCSDHGNCWSEGTRAECRCDEGYHTEGLDCVSDTAGDGDADGDSDVDGDADGDSDVDADSDVDSDADGDGGGPCDPFALTACDDGEKCALVSADSGATWRAQCIPLPDPSAGPLEPCSTGDPDGDGLHHDDCPQGYVCGDRTEITGDAVCYRLCASGRESLCASAYGGEDGLCLFPAPHTGVTGGGEIRACSPIDSCDPRCSDACGRGGHSCYSAWDGVSAGTVCLPVGTAGAACDGTVNDCAAGRACWEGQCRQYCDLARNATCATWPACDGGLSCADPGHAEMFTDIGTGVCM